MFFFLYFKILILSSFIFPPIKKGGDIFEPGLLEIPITVKSLQSAAVMIIVDLSKPQNLVESLLKWIKAIREGCDCENNYSIHLICNKTSIVLNSYSYYIQLYY